MEQITPPLERVFGQRWQSEEALPLDVLKPLIGHLSLRDMEMFRDDLEVLEEFFLKPIASSGQGTLLYTVAPSGISPSRLLQERTRAVYCDLDDHIVPMSAVTFLADPKSSILPARQSTRLRAGEDPQADIEDPRTLLAMTLMLAARAADLGVDVALGTTGLDEQTIAFIEAMRHRGMETHALVMDGVETPLRQSFHERSRYTPPSWQAVEDAAFADTLRSVHIPILADEVEIFWQDGSLTTPKPAMSARRASNGDPGALHIYDQEALIAFCRKSGMTELLDGGLPRGAVSLRRSDMFTAKISSRGMHARRAERMLGDVSEASLFTWSEIGEKIADLTDRDLFDLRQDLMMLSDIIVPETRDPDTLGPEFIHTVGIDPAAMTRLLEEKVAARKGFSGVSSAREQRIAYLNPSHNILPLLTGYQRDMEQSLQTGLAARPDFESSWRAAAEAGAMVLANLAVSRGVNIAMATSGTSPDWPARFHKLNQRRYEVSSCVVASHQTGQSADLETLVDALRQVYLTGKNQGTVGFFWCHEFGNQKVQAIDFDECGGLEATTNYGLPGPFMSVCNTLTLHPSELATPATSITRKQERHKPYLRPVAS